MASLDHDARPNVRLFGFGLVEYEGRRTRTQKERWLLARLLLQRDRPIGRGALADELWPDSDQARANLRRCLWNLRAVLGETAFRLESSGSDLLTLHPEALDVDLLSFDALIRDGTSVALAEAVNLYTGPLLAGCLEDWILPDRAARERVCLQSLRRLADEAGDANDLATANHHLRRALALDPFNEETVCSLMLALADQGELAAANQVYRNLRQRLSEHLLPAPNPKTQALFESLRAGNRQHASERIAHGVTRPTVLPNWIPQSEHRLIGREQAVWEVSALLSQARLVALVGIGGIGKTRLATAVAQECAADYTQGVCFVDLSALSDPKLVVQAVASLQNIPERAGEGLLQTLQADLADRSLLLVLDNCEHLRAACADLCESLLAHCPDLRILATSREPLGLAPEVETVWRVPSLELPPQPREGNGAAIGGGEKAALSRALGFGAIRLFVERARQTQPRFSAGPADVEAVTQICRRLDGNALAIELAAARVSTLSVDEIAARLDDRFQLLQGGKPGTPRRQQALHASLDWSYDLLTNAEQTLLSRLSVFAGGWTLPAAEAVCEEAPDILSSLVNKSLVMVEDAQSREARYRLLETVREYARKRLVASGVAAATGRRHRDYFLALVEGSDTHGPGLKDWVEQLERERDNVRAALGYCLKTKDEGGLRLGAGLYVFWEARGYFTEGRERLAALLSQAERRPPTLAFAKALNSAGKLAICQGDYTVARAQLERSLVLARNLEDRGAVASALDGLGHVCHWQGDYAAARALFEESLAKAQEAGMGTSAETLSKLGEVAREQGDYERARALQEESLAVARYLGDLGSVYIALGNLGNVAQNQGDYRAARALYAEGLALARDWGYPRHVTLFLGNLGTMAQMEGDFSGALVAFEECLGLLEELGDKRNSATALVALGSLHCKTDNYAQARIRLAECLWILQQTSDRYFTATALMACASLARAQGFMACAARLYGGAEALRTAIGASLTLDEEVEYRREIEEVRAALGMERFERIWYEGQALTLKQAIEIGLDFLTGISDSL